MQKIERFKWIDTAKVSLIFLVVIGHLHYGFAPVPGKNIIYAFHVPAFLFVTGFLLPKNFGQTELREVTHRWLGPYVRAYGLFSGLALALWWADLSLRAGELVSPLPGILGVFYGVAGQENFFQHHNQPLWYFTFLIVSLIGARACAALPVSTGWSLAAALATFAALYDGPRLPWNLDVGGMGVIALFAGHRLRHNWDSLRRFFEPPSRAAKMLALGLTALAAISYLNGATNINGASFGQSGLLYVISMAAGFCAIIALGMLVPAQRIFATISAETLTIFALHFYFVRVAESLIQRPDSRLAQVVVMILLSLMIIAICFVLARFFKPLLDRVIFFRPR